MKGQKGYKRRENASKVAVLMPYTACFGQRNTYTCKPQECIAGRSHHWMDTFCHHLLKPRGREQVMAACCPGVYKTWKAWSKVCF